jgi:hypothetical protein
MPRDNIPQSATKKLQQFFTKTLGKDVLFFFIPIIIIIILLYIDTNNDGLVNWTDFEAAIEVLFNEI